MAEKIAPIEMKRTTRIIPPKVPTGLAVEGRKARIMLCHFSTEELEQIGARFTKDLLAMAARQAESLPAD